MLIALITFALFDINLVSLVMAKQIMLVIVAKVYQSLMLLVIRMKQVFIIRLPMPIAAVNNAH